jgi:UDP-glucose 4-epimerase
MNWLITGGCGFIGVNLISRLRQTEGHRLRVVDNGAVGTAEDLKAVCEITVTPGARLGAFTNSVELVLGDILNEELALRAVAGADVIVHLAANTGVTPSVENPRADCLTNVVGTLNYLEAARREGARFILASSGGTVVGERTPPIHEEMAPHPAAPYGASKLAGEGYCAAYFGSFGLEAVALRFANVYGPHSQHKNSVVASFMQRALDGKALQVNGGGEQTRDFVYVEDVVAAIHASAVRPVLGGQVMHIASGRETSVLELLELLTGLLEARGLRPTVHHAPARPGEISRNCADPAKACRLLGWRPQTSLEEGLARTLEWFAR